MTSLTSADGTPDASQLEDILQRRSVHTLLQPIVELDSGAVVAFEALSRGPDGALHRPDLLFACARAAGRLAELDRLCREVALETAARIGVTAPLLLFVNVEPEVVDSGQLAELIPIAERAEGTLRVVLEITERAISARPAQLLATVRQLRSAGWRVALDDVGSDDMSLAFMELLQPDIVKLDMSVVQQRPGRAVVQIMHAVNAYAERTGALVLAEGIEHERHLAAARALGARLGQGWLFGRPAATIGSLLPVAELELGAPFPTALASSPFACLPKDFVLRRSTKPLLIEFSRFLEREAARLGSTCLILSTFQHAAHFTPATALRYEELARRVGLVAALGEGLATEPAPGVRGNALAAGDPVCGEWDIVIIAPHFAAALLAQDLGDTGPDRHRRFEFALTYDRTTVAAAAKVLMSRVCAETAVTARAENPAEIDISEYTVAS